MVHSEPFMPSMARLVHMLVFQEMLLLFPLDVLHAQYAAIGAAYAVTLLFSRLLGWSLPAGIHSCRCRELTTAALLLAIALHIGPTIAIDVALFVYFAMPDLYLFWPLKRAPKQQKQHARSSTRCNEATGSSRKRPAAAMQIPDATTHKQSSPKMARSMSQVGKPPAGKGNPPQVGHVTATDAIERNTHVECDAAITTADLPCRLCHLRSLWRGIAAGEAMQNGLASRDSAKYPRAIGLVAVVSVLLHALPRHQSRRARDPRKHRL